MRASALPRCLRGSLNPCEGRKAGRSAPEREEHRFAKGQEGEGRGRSVPERWSLWRWPRGARGAGSFGLGGKAQPQVPGASVQLLEGESSWLRPGRDASKEGSGLEGLAFCAAPGGGPADWIARGEGVRARKAGTPSRHPVSAPSGPGLGLRRALVVPGKEAGAQPGSSPLRGAARRQRPGDFAGKTGG